MSHDIRSVAEAIRAGGVVAYPTEGVWGLGCDPCNEAAVERILALKGRRREQGLILLAANSEQLTPFIKPLPKEIMQRLRTTGADPVTWIVPARTDCPAWLTGGRGTIAVRITAHPPARQLARAAGTALVSTSANRHGEPPANGPQALRSIFGSSLDAIHEAPLGYAAGPSEIRDAVTGRILRAATRRSS